MYTVSQRKVFFLAAGLVAAAISSSTQAAVLTGSYDANPGTSFNLTDLGSSDWAIFASADGSHTNSKAGGSAISNAVVVGGGTGRTVGGPGVTYSFSDGTNPVSGSISPVGFANDLFHTAGAGFQFQVTNPTTSTMTVNVFVSGYETGNNTFTASRPGADDYVQTSSSYASNPAKPIRVYTLQFTPDAVDGVSNVLTVRYEMTGILDHGNGHVLLSAVTAYVPEPATMAIVGMGGMLLLRRKRA